MALYKLSAAKHGTQMLDPDTLSCALIVQPLMLYGCAYQDLQRPKKGSCFSKETFHKLVHFQFMGWGGLTF